VKEDHVKEEHNVQDEIYLKSVRMLNKPKQFDILLLERIHLRYETKIRSGTVQTQETFIKF